LYILIIVAFFLRRRHIDYKEVLMKNLSAHFVLFVILSVAFSSFTACTNTASTQKGPVDETAASSNNSTIDQTKGGYPPAPSGIMQAEINDVDGNVFKLEDKKGKVLLVNLWATWCGPCRGEMPDLIEMQDKYKDQDFEVIGLDADDETPEEIKAFAEKMKLNYQLGYARNHLRSEFIRVTRMGGIPQSIVINREGQLVGVFTGGGASVLNKMKATVEKTVAE
jgi:thiol-disulfide isomerase/thioredoxin